MPKIEMCAKLYLEKALIRNNEQGFDGESFPCGYQPWCDHCEGDHLYSCSDAFIEFTRGNQTGGEVK